MKESPIMRKTQTYFEQIPVEKVKAMLVHFPESLELRPPVSASLHHVLRCTICHEPVPVETAKTDSYGKAIHEECYLLSVAGKTVIARPASNPGV
jgi:formylmethanofuran dehydrogenase subunit E